MARNRQTYTDPTLVATRATMIPTVLGATNEGHQGLFSVYSYAMNRKPGDDNPDHKNKGGIEYNGIRFSFPGNISPEGYFYSPFYEVNLKEVDDELQSARVRRINFAPSSASVIESSVTFYNPETGVFENKDVWNIYVTSPINYNFMGGQPFSIYDALDEVTYRGYLDAFSSTTSGCRIVITTYEKIDQDGLRGDTTSGLSRYYICLIEENVPDYAEYIPSTNKLVWRAPRKMSDLPSDSPLYNMPFTNGRLYIHRNLNVYVRRQDPHDDYKLFRPSQNNPLRRYQIEGEAKLDFDYIQQIIDSMVDAC